MSVKTINISLPSDLIAEIDNLAREEFTSRSDYIRSSLVKRVRSSKKLAQKEQLDRQRALLELEEHARDLENCDVTDQEIVDFVYELRHKR